MLSLLVSAAAAAPLPSRRNEIVEVVEKVSPAVVNIAAEQTVRRRRSFEDLFFGFELRPRTAKSLGSGVLIDPKGIILTNDHVISGASKIIATTKSGRELECEVLGSDADNDLAVLRVKKLGAPLPTIRLGTSSDLMIGETIVAIGNPFGLSNTVTAGVLSAVGRSVPGENQRVYSDFLQIDAPINPGNSGGPVVNIHGDMIGVATAIVGGAQGIGFAIPVDRAKRIASDLQRFGEVKPVWIGLHGRTISSRNDDDRPRGFRVRNVEQGSPAEHAGIRAGDQILSVDSMPIESEESFQTALSTRGQKLDRVLAIMVPDEEIVKRISGRRTCRNCGAMFHTVFDPPRNLGVCNNCNGELYQREDDAEDTVRTRLDVYAAATRPLLDYYEQRGLLSRIDGVGRPEDIEARIRSALQRRAAGAK